MKQRAFTLAEVLITLCVIGVVAAITLPILLTKINDRIMINKLKKFYSTMAQAVKLNEQENPDGYYTKEHLLDVFTIKTICTENDTSCAPQKYKKYNGSNATNWGINDDQKTTANYAILADGSIIRYTAHVGNKTITDSCNGVMGTSEALSSICSEVSVDLNGKTPPNTLGKDVFFFYITAHGVIPFGNKDITYENSKFSKCRTTGYGCAAYALLFETFDYTKHNF